MLYIKLDYFFNALSSRKNISEFINILKKEALKLKT